MGIRYMITAVEQIYDLVVAANDAQAAHDAEEDSHKDECDEVLCALYCENGFKSNENGCLTCTCNPPTCREGEQLIGDTCVLPFQEEAPVKCCAAFIHYPHVQKWCEESADTWVASEGACTQAWYVEKKKEKQTENIDLPAFIEVLESWSACNTLKVEKSQMSDIFAAIDLNGDGKIIADEAIYLDKDVCGIAAISAIRPSTG